MANKQSNIYKNEEIDLFQLGLILWKKKFLITIITTIFTLVAIIYAFSATPIYQVQSILRPAPIKDLEPLNSTEILKISPTNALYAVADKLNSYDTRLRFFKENKALFEPLRKPNKTLEQLFERFNQKAFSLFYPEQNESSSANSSPYIGIRLEYSADIDGTKIINRFVQFAVNEEKDNLQANYHSLLQNKIARIEKELVVLRTEYAAQKDSKIKILLEEDALERALLLDELAAVRNQLELNRQNRIQQLEESISIALALNIHKPTSPTQLGRLTNEHPAFYAEVTNQTPPLYFMGTEALQAELDALLERKSNDFTSSRISEIKKKLQLLENNRKVEILEARDNEDLFISEQAAIKKRLAHLESFHVDFDTLNIVNIDQVAYPPFQPIKPNKRLITLIGLLLGLMTGTFIALIQSAFQHRAENS